MASSTQPLVSVVIPCYNQGRFLRDAIDSVLAQTHPDVEVIVVDDGSTDDTASVAHSRPAVRYIHQENGGAAAARNAGFAASRGDYVIFLDADDRLLPHAVASGVESLAAHTDWAFVTGHVRLISEDGSPEQPFPQEHMPPSYVELLRSNYIWTPGVVMYRRTAFETVRGFDSGTGGSADYALNIQLARRFPVGCHHQVILDYRRHGMNMSGDVRYMLKSALSVRRAEALHARRTPEGRLALAEGIARVRADFGRRLVDQVKADLLSGGRTGRVLSGVLGLLRFYPAGILDLVRGGITRAIAGSPSPDR